MAEEEGAPAPETQTEKPKKNGVALTMALRKPIQANGEEVTS